MASHKSSLFSMVLTITLMFLSSEAQLSSNFYDTSCPNALTLINSAVTAAIDNEQRMAASLIRLHFHDCFVQVTNLTREDDLLTQHIYNLC